MAQQTPAGGLSRESLQRLTGFLLVVSAASFTAVIGLSLFIYLEKQDTAELRGSLLAQEQLQRELLAGQDSDRAPYPHLDPGISFVLNPGMGQATWKTGPELPYRINSIGLRGREIRPKAQGVSRIALVGDSVLFGWKLKDDDRLADQLQDMANRRFGAGSYEFITLALPGWNTRDQARFLRRHLARLNPDYIVWSIIRNDLLDTGGVVPPGLLATWNSPHKQLEQPFQFLPPARVRDAPAPAILSRWVSNLRQIESFAGEFDIPTSLLWWRARHRALFDYVLADSGVDLPVLYIPGSFRYDQENWCIAFPDCHPTRWANELLAIGVMDLLASHGVIPDPGWSEEERRVTAAFRQERQQGSSPEQQLAFLRDQAARIPDRMSGSDEAGVVFGLRGGRMQRNGMLLLRQAGTAAALEMDVEPLWQRPGPALQMDLRVSNSSGQAVTASYPIEPAGRQIRLELPVDTTFGLYQLEWLFNYSECERPSACFSARLRSARLLTGPD